MSSSATDIRHGTERGRNSKSRYRTTKGWVQDHPVLTVFVISLLTRALVVAIIAIAVGGGGVFPDDMFYNKLAVEAASGENADWGSWSEGLYWRTATFIMPLTWLYEIFGPITWIGQLYVAILGAATAAITTRLGMEMKLGSGWAIFAGATVGFLPSQVLFSSLTLKDAAVWAVLAGLAMVLAVAGRATDRRRLLLLAASGVLLLFMMRHLRAHTLVVCLWAVAIAAWFGQERQRLARGIGTFLLLLILPMTFGLGPAGVDFITSAGSLEKRRAANASHADTAFVPDQEQLAQERAQEFDRFADSGNGDGEGPDGTADSADGDGERPDGTADSADGDGERPDGTADSAEGDGEGPDGHVDPEDGDREGLATDVGEGWDGGGTAARGKGGNVGGFSRDLSHLPYGVAVMLVGPFPWWGEGNARLTLAKWAMVIWYPLVLFAIIGMFSVWRYRRTMAFPVLVGGGMLLLYALAEGNFGTAYRHRGEFVWVVALLAAIGLKHAVDWIRDRRARTSSGSGTTPRSP